MRMPRTLAFVTSLVLVGCLPPSSLQPSAPIMSTEGQMPDQLVLTSPEFKDGGAIPRRFTCDAENVSPPLSWSGAPAGAVTLALVMDDPDARGFVHWVVYGIPPGTQGLAEGSLPSDARQGANGRNQDQWAGPCPPVGSAPHHYRFTLTAVSKSLALAPGATAAQVKAAMAGSIIGQGLLVGLYGR